MVNDTCKELSDNTGVQSINGTTAKKDNSAKVLTINMAGGMFSNNHMERRVRGGMVTGLNL